jgi:phosphatidylglycerophosphatase A
MMVLRPTPAFAYSHPAHIIAFGVGAGLARFAPGSFGTLAAWLPGWLLAGAHPAILLPLVAALFLLGVWACGVTGRHLGVHDHGSMVIRWIERRWQGGFGVMFDDLVAAGYTLLVLALVKRFFF